MCDIFISYRHHDDAGNTTEDYAIAYKLHNELSELGYKVFFSQKSLEEIGSSRFKADIDAALDSAKILIVVLTKAEYATSKWVQYEWDSFYGDYLSGVKSNAYLFTFIKDFSIARLPRTLRNVQSFNINEGTSALINHIKNSINLAVSSRYLVKTGTTITYEDIKEAVKLDHIVYAGMEHVDVDECYSWHKLNKDIYIIIKDTNTNKVVAYTNTTPITEECYNKIKSGEFLTTNITQDMILPYEMPSPYNLYFFSIVIHPDYQNTGLFSIMLNTLIDKFIQFAKQDIFIKRMIADAVTSNGEKFCTLFGMRKITQSTHSSTLYEVQLIPPKFKKISIKAKELYEYYQQLYEKKPSFFDEQ